MDSHPVSIARFLGDAALVATIAGMVPSVLLGTGPAPLAWAGIIFLVALLGGTAPSAAARIWPRGADAAWDEQVDRSRLVSRAFGYWATLAVFLALLTAVWLGAVSPAAAFFWIGTPLAVAPPLWMFLAFLRGRAG